MKRRQESEPPRSFLNFFSFLLRLVSWIAASPLDFALAATLRMLMLQQEPAYTNKQRKNKISLETIMKWMEIDKEIACGDNNQANGVLSNFVPRTDSFAFQPIVCKLMSTYLSRVHDLNYPCMRTLVQTCSCHSWALSTLICFQKNTELFCSGYGYHPHCNAENDHLKRRHSKTLSRVERFENDAFWKSCFLVWLRKRCYLKTVTSWK